MRGACWVLVDGETEPQRMEAGDCFLLTRGRSFVLATDLSRSPVQSASIYERAVDGIATCNGGGDFFLIGGRFRYDTDHADMLIETLPAVVHIHDASNQAAVLRWALEQLVTELKLGTPGGPLMMDHLAQMMLLQVLRLWLETRSGRPSGWIGALADRQLAKALGAMHREPGRSWTLRELAGLAGMSRTTFSERFRASVGRTPIDYLIHWRMRLAADRLRHSDDSAAQIALAAGYESEAAFSTAFRRVIGCSPGRYRRGGLS
jgi:AraC-like DNA-binding protein